MDRIIPYGYPTIPGGASGGASVDPTPPSSDDPDTPVTLPYNLDDLVFQCDSIRSNADQIANVWVAKTTASTEVYIDYNNTVDGIVPVDLTGVKQVSIVGPAASDDSVVITADGTSIKNLLVSGSDAYPISLTINFSIFQDSSGFHLITNSQAARFGKTNWNTLNGKQIVVKWPLTITVYDTAGEVMQEYETELTI